jgi:tetratricopeptide (TPR) repeat protein
MVLIVRATKKKQHGALINMQTEHTADPVVHAQLQQCQKSIAKIEHAWGRNHQRLLPALKNLADLYFAIEMFAEAEQVYWRYLSITAKEFGDTHPIVAGSLQFIGETFEAQGLFAEAERYYLYALDARRKSGARIEQLVEPYARLIHLYRQQREYRKASLTEEQLAFCLQLVQTKQTNFHQGVNSSEGGPRLALSSTCC